MIERTDLAFLALTMVMMQKPLPKDPALLIPLLDAKIPFGLKQRTNDNHNFETFISAEKMNEILKVLREYEDRKQKEQEPV